MSVCNGGQHRASTSLEGKFWKDIYERVTYDVDLEGDTRILGSNMLSVTWEGEVFERDGYIPTAPGHIQVSLVFYLEDWPYFWEPRSAWLYPQLPEASRVARRVSNKPPPRNSEGPPKSCKLNPIVKTVKNC